MAAIYAKLANHVAETAYWSIYVALKIKKRDKTIMTDNSLFDRIHHLDDLGKLLRDIRQAHPHPLAYYADRMHLPSQTLEAIESGNWSRLAAQAYGVGYLKRYSELLGLDAEAALACYHKIKEQEVPPLRYLPPLQPSGHPMMPERKWLGNALMALIVAAGAMLAYSKLDNVAVTEIFAIREQPQITYQPISPPATVAAITVKTATQTLTPPRCAVLAYRRDLPCYSRQTHYPSFMSAMSKTAYPIWLRSTL